MALDSQVKLEAECNHLKRYKPIRMRITRQETRVTKFWKLGSR